MKSHNVISSSQRYVMCHWNSERPRGRLFPVGGDWVYRRQYRPIELEMQTFAGISLSDVNAILQKFPLTKCTTLTIGPLGKVKEPK